MKRPINNGWGLNAVYRPIYECSNNIVAHKSKMSGYKQKTKKLPPQLLKCMLMGPGIGLTCKHTYATKTCTFGTYVCTYIQCRYIHMHM